MENKYNSEMIAKKFKKNIEVMKTVDESLDNFIFYNEEKYTVEEIIKNRYSLKDNIHETNEYLKDDYIVTKLTPEEIENKIKIKYAKELNEEEDYCNLSSQSNNVNDKIIKKENTNSFKKIGGHILKLFGVKFLPLELKNRIIKIKELFIADSPSIHFIMDVVKENKDKYLPEKYKQRLEDKIAYVIRYDNEYDNKIELLEELIKQDVFKKRYLKEFIFTKEGQNIINPILSEMRKIDFNDGKLKSTKLRYYENLLKVIINNLNDKKFQDYLKEELHNSIIKCEKINPKLYFEYHNKIGTEFQHTSLIEFSNLNIIYKNPYFLEKIYEHTTHEEHLQLRIKLINSLKLSSIKIKDKFNKSLGNTQEFSTYKNIIEVFDNLIYQYNSKNLCIEEQLILKEKETIKSLPLLAQKTIKEIRYLYDEINKDRKNAFENNIISIEQQHDIDLIINRRIPNTVEKYFAIDERFRSKVNHSGKDADTILNENLTNMKEIMYYLLEKINEYKLNSLNVEKRIINNVRDKYSDDIKVPEVLEKDLSAKQINFLLNNKIKKSKI